MNTRLMALVGALLALSVAAVIVGRQRAASPEALKETAVRMMREGRGAEAIPILADAVSRKPNFAEGYQALGVAYGIVGDEAASEACLERAIALKPEYPLAVFNLAAIRERQGRHEEALRLLAQAEGMKGGYARARSARSAILLAMGKAAAAAGDLAGAERLCTNAVEADRDSAEAHYALGKLRQRQGRFREAVAEFILATKIRPGARIGPSLRDSYAELGAELTRAGDHAAAADAYRRAVLLDGGSGALRYRYGAALVRRGERARGAREIEAARRSGAAIGEPDSGLAADLASKARGAAAAGDLDGAEALLDLAALTDPGRALSTERAEIAAGRGDRAARDGDEAAALRFYEEAEKAAPGMPGLAGKLARALAAAGRRAEAIERYELLCAKGRRGPDCLSILGGLYEADGDFARAADCYAEGGAGMRGRLVALYDKWASVEKDPAVAAELYRKCSELDPGNDWYRGERALALARNGECAKALGEIRSLMKGMRRPPVPLLDPLRIRRLESVRLAEGAVRATGTHVWRFSLKGMESANLGEFTVSDGAQGFVPGEEYKGEKPLALRIVFKGPDAIEGESALDIRYDGGRRKRILCPVLRPSSVICADNDGFTYSSSFDVVRRVAIPRGTLPYQRWNHLRGLICRLCGREKEAQECADYHSRWGHAYYSIMYDREAGDELRRALDIHPAHSQARLLLTLLLYREKRYDEAAAEIRRAAAIRPESAVPINDEGVVLAARGSYQDAEMLLLRAAEKDKRLLTACRNLVELYRRMGRRVEEQFWGFQAARLEESRNFYEDGLSL